MSQTDPTTLHAEDHAPDRRQHYVACFFGVFVVAVGNAVANTLGPVVGLTGILLMASALSGTLIAAVGLRHNPPRHGRLALALTAVPAIIVVLLLVWVLVMLVALGGGNPNS